ncbi:hypothetical protein WS83_01105 [Burkholderia sp. MSMB2042]|nr:hypothetical protein WS83_01105 [Burkholderia sp. MSMB2042]KVG98091.1 hypothetical protein WS82_00820 [Burkholderia sp. MSMB2041]
MLSPSARRSPAHRALRLDQRPDAHRGFRRRAIADVSAFAANAEQDQRAIKAFGAEQATRTTRDCAQSQQTDAAPPIGRQ